MTRPAAFTESPWFALAWYGVLLAVVFTTAFWVGRVAGPGGVEPVDDAPSHAPSHATSHALGDAPHAAAVR